MSGRFAVCRFDPSHPAPTASDEVQFWSLTRTASELSLVCGESQAPEDAELEKGWRCLEVEGPLDFSLTGVLSSLLGPLADNGISVFTISTYDTDYLLVKENELEQAVVVLADAGHETRGLSI